MDGRVVLQGMRVLCRAKSVPGRLKGDLRMSRKDRKMEMCSRTRGNCSGRVQQSSDSNTTCISFRRLHGSKKVTRR